MVIIIILLIFTTCVFDRVFLFLRNSLLCRSVCYNIAVHSLNQLRDLQNNNSRNSLTLQSCVSTEHGQNSSFRHSQALILMLQKHLSTEFLEKILSFIFREGGGRRKRGREISMYERNIDWLPLAYPQLETWLATQACALTGNRTSDLSVCGAMLNPLNYTSQGCAEFFI